MFVTSSYCSNSPNCVEVDLSWWKSSYSAANGNCVEVGWEKSSHSFSNGNCVEVRKAATVGVRDTKEQHLGTGRVILGFSREAWQDFTQRVKDGSTWG
jgi:hypothetical protein